MEKVIKHVLKKYKKNGKIFDAIAILQPTSPLRKKETIIKAVNKFIKYRPDYLTSISEIKHNQNPKMLFKVDNINLQKINIPINNQNNPYHCLDGGVIFIFKVPNKNYAFKGKASFIKVKFPENIDIDTIDEFLLAKKFFN